MELIKTYWNNSNEVITAIENANKIKMSTEEFLSHCTACGGDWGAMLLTGIKALWPAVWDAIPNHMGPMAWGCLCEVVATLTMQED